jgi:hypothetical protein
MPGKGRPFQVGQIGDPKGRPKGAKDKFPRGFLRRVYEGACQREEQDLRKFAESMLVDRRYGLQA